MRFTGSEFDMMLRRSDEGWTEVVTNEGSVVSRVSACDVELAVARKSSSSDDRGCVRSRRCVVLLFAYSGAHNLLDLVRVSGRCV